MASESTHPSLLARVRDPANRAAWRTFEARYGPLITGYCRSIGLQLADAEDIRQDVMLSLSGAMPGFEYQPRRGRFRSYLGQAVRHAVARHLSRHSRSAAALDQSVLDRVAGEDGRHNDRRWDEQWVAHHCRLALEALRRTSEPAHLEALTRLLEGQSTEQVAATLGLTEPGVRKIKQRLRDRLREIVARQIRDEDARHE